MSWRFLFLPFTFLVVIAQIFYFNRDVLLWLKSSEQINVLLLSYPRSGSSFVGELLSSCEDCSYFFEPLFLEEHIHKTPTTSAYQKNLDGVFSCDRLLLHNLRFESDFWAVRKFASFYGTFNVSDETVVEYCKKDKMKVVKTIRFRMAEVEPLLKKFKNLKIIHLVRDPRGVLNSVRKRLHDWSKKDNSATRFCTNMVNDVNEGKKLSKRRYYLIHYENLVIQPYEEVKKIFKFLDHPITNNVKLFLEKHTKAEKDPIGKQESSSYYSTFRHSSFDPFAWKTEMSKRDKGKIEIVCKEALTKLNYVHL